MSLTLSEVAGLQTSKYFNVAGIAILTQDYMITLEDEVRWVWGHKWDVTRFVFMVSRYLPFVGAGLTAYGGLPAIEHNRFSGNVAHFLSIIAAEILLILRTCAFWQGDKRVVYGLFLYACITIGAAVALNVTHTKLLPDGTTFSGFFLIDSARNSTFVYLCLLMFEIVMLCLTAYKQFHTYHKVTVPIVHTLYRDSMFYMVCIILITFANVILDGIFPLQFSNLLDIPQIALHSVLASRITFNLRKASYDPQGWGDADPAPLSELAYRTPSGSESGGSSEPSGSQGVTNAHLDIDIDLSGFDCHWDPVASRDR